LPPSGLTAILGKLLDEDVRFVLVGGLAAVVQGSPHMTRDVDIVHARDEENLDRLLRVLSDVNAVYRGRPGAPLAPARANLAGLGHHLLRTDLGPLDVLGAIEAGRDFDALQPESLTLPFGSHELRVLSLESIVRFKRQSKHEKDKLMLPALEAALRRRGR
jgi:hypothetical protein